MTDHPGADYPRDIFAEPHPVDVNTLANLGPLTGMAGIWQGEKGVDIKPKADGPRRQIYVERMELQPIDPVTNGPQLLYGLRYLTIVNKPEQPKTYHEQVGYWLWEPAHGVIMHSLAIPRGQITMAAGVCAADATSFTLTARHGATDYGVCATPFLDYAFRTVSFKITVTLNPDDSWSYAEETLLKIRDRDELFPHTDSNHMIRLAAPTPNPLAR